MSPRALVIGLDCAAPELLFDDDALPSFRGLMSRGVFGELESVVPPITVPAWMCLSASQDPGTLGVYGFRNRTDHTYANLGVVTSQSFPGPFIWDDLAAAGKRSVLVGVPPMFPPRAIHGATVGCFLTPDTATSVFTHPPELGAQLNQLVDGYPVDVRGFRSDDKQWLLDQIHEMTRKHFVAIRHLMDTQAWDYFHFVEIGLDRIHHGFWKHHDPLHRQHVPNSPFATCIRDYYRVLDAEVASLLQRLRPDDVVLVVSDHGARRLEGGFCVNEWLIQQGLLVLAEPPPAGALTPFGKLKVDWSRTRAWSEGGYYARVFFNVKGREPQGVIDPADLPRFRDELTAQLLALPDDRGQPMGSLVWRPEQLYRTVSRVAPDLLVHFGALAWRSVGSVGHGTLYVQENDTGPDDCNHAQMGAFILAGPGVPAEGRVAGKRLLDVAPTLLDLLGLPVPSRMQGVPMTAKAAG